MQEPNIPRLFQTIPKAESPPRFLETKRPPRQGSGNPRLSLLGRCPEWVIIDRWEDAQFGRVSDVHFGLATLHALVGVTAGAKHRYAYPGRSPSEEGLSMACRTVKCTSETRPARVIARHSLAESPASHRNPRPVLSSPHSCPQGIRVIRVMCCPCWTKSNGLSSTSA